RRVAREMVGARKIDRDVVLATWQLERGRAGDDDPGHILVRLAVRTDLVSEAGGHIQYRLTSSLQNGEADLAQLQVKRAVAGCARGNRHALQPLRGGAAPIIARRWRRIGHADVVSAGGE